ncbi:MAG: hypothetical protein ACWA5U_06475 [bacterium]
MASVKQLEIKHLFEKILPFAILLSVAIFWNELSWQKQSEHLLTSDTTQVFYQIIQNTPLVEPINGDWHYIDVVQNVLQHFSQTLAEYGLLAYQPLRDAYISAVYEITGDPFDAYRVVSLPLNFIFLLGAWLLFRVLGAPQYLALILASLLSAPWLIPLAGEQFGMGAATIYSRRHFMTAFIPLLMYVYYKRLVYQQSLMPVFVFVGLVANLHASALLFAEILILHFLLYQTGRNQRLSSALILKALGFFIITLCAGLIAFGSLFKPLLIAFQQLANSFLDFSTAYASATSIDIILDQYLQQPIDSHLRYLFFPWRFYQDIGSFGQIILMLSSLLLFVFFAIRQLLGKAQPAFLFALSLFSLVFLLGKQAVLPLLLLMGLMAYNHLYRRNDYISQYTSAIHFTNLLGIAIFITAVLGTLIFQAAYLLVDGFPLIYNQLRASRFIWLAYFMLLAIQLTIFFKPDHTKRNNNLRRYIVIVLLIMTVLYEVRHIYRSFIYDNLRIEQRDFYHIAYWAKKNTPKDSLFLVKSSIFGVISHRQVALQDKQASHNFDWGSDNYEQAIQACHDYNCTHLLLKKSAENQVDTRLYRIFAPSIIYHNHSYYVLVIKK